MENGHHHHHLILRNWKLSKGISLSVAESLLLLLSRASEAQTGSRSDVKIYDLLIYNTLISRFSMIINH